MTAIPQNELRGPVSLCVPPPVSPRARNLSVRPEHVQGRNRLLFPAVLALLAVILCLGVNVSPAMALTPEELAIQLFKEPDPARRLTLMEQNREMINRELIDSLVESAQPLFSGGDSDSTFALLDMAEELSGFIGDENEKAWCIMKRGDYLYSSGKNQQAMEQYQTALEIHISLKDELEAADCYLRQGIVYLEIYDNQAAIEKYEQALQLFKKAEDLLAAADCCRRQSDIFFITGDNQAAIEKYAQALELLKKAWDPVEDKRYCFPDDKFYDPRGCWPDNNDPFYYTKITVENANFYFRQGEIFSRTGDSQAALEKYEQALPLYQKAGAPGGEADCYHRQGGVFLRTGNPQAALEKYEQALALYKQAGAPGGEANCYFIKGVVYRMMGDNIAALEKYEQALPLYKQAGDSLGEASCYLLQGEVYRTTDDNQAALEKYAQALALFKKIGNPQGEAGCYEGQGHVFLRTGDHKSALEKYAQALTLFEKINNPLSIMWNRFSTGAAYRALGDKAKAREEYLAALDQGEKLVSRAGSEEMKRGAMEQQADIYAETIDLLLEMGLDGEAFGVLERMRGSVMREMLEQGRIDPLARAPEAVREKAAEIKARMDAAMAAFTADLQKPGGGDAHQQAELLEKHKKAAGELDMLMSEASAAYGAASALGAGVKALDAEGVRAALPEGTLLLEYFLGPKRSVVFVVSAAGFERKDLPCGEAELGGWIQAFNAHIQAWIDWLGKYKQARDRRPGPLSTGELYSCLLGPVETEIMAAKTALISPDRELNYLPFEALKPDGGGGYGLFGPERVPVYVMSGTMYAADLKRVESNPRNFGEEKILALGYADFGSGNYGPPPDWKRRSAVALAPGPEDATGRIDGGGPRSLALSAWERNARGAIEELPGTLGEVEKIRALFGPLAEVLVWLDATESNARKEMNSLGIVHFATHGLLMPEDPLSSGLLLSEIGLRAGGGNAQEDGILTAREIMLDPRIELPGGLAVLSACETGKGELTRSEGVIGLTRAFAAAGTRAQIVSLWSVNDVSTGLLFQFFYTRLKAGEPPAQALAAAKEDLRNYTPPGGTKPPYSSPFFWAPFIYTGAQ